jgi:hypothetical protein
MPLRNFFTLHCEHKNPKCEHPVNTNLLKLNL